MITAVAARSDEVPRDLALEQNFPNPFNPTTVLSFRLPVAGSVRLTVYDLLGREVAVLVDERKAPGTYDVTFDGARFASGMYLCRLTAGEGVASRKMLLTK
jgi:hypothetical protein